MSWSRRIFFSGVCINFLALVYFQTLVLFFWDGFSKRFIIALLFSFMALYHSAFIFSDTCVIFWDCFSKRFIIALLFSFMALYHNAFISFHCAYFFLGKSFYSIFLNASKCLFFILDASQRLFLILLSMKQCPIFVSKQFLDHNSSLFCGLFLNMFQMLILICTKLLGFDRLFNLTMGHNKGLIRPHSYYTNSALWNRVIEGSARSQLSPFRSV
jgi:hypothetical protein